MKKINVDVCIDYWLEICPLDDVENAPLFNCEGCEFFKGYDEDS